jgi:hypothetical protein
MSGMRAKDTRIGKLFVLCRLVLGSVSNRKVRFAAKLPFSSPPSPGTLAVFNLFLDFS